MWRLSSFTQRGAALSQGFLELWVWGLKNESGWNCRRWAEVMSSCLPGESLAYLRFGLCLKSYWCLMGNWKNISFQKQYCALSSIFSCPLSVFIKCWLWDSWRGQILWFLNGQKVEFSQTDACWIGLWGLMEHLSPGLISFGSSAYMNSRDLLGIMIKWGIYIRSDCSALKSALHDL